MKILALDMAAKCGYAWTDTETKRSESGTWNFTPKSNESKEVKLLRFRKALGDTGRLMGGIDLLVYESIRCIRHTQALIALAEMQGIAKTFAAQRKIAAKGYESSTIKAFATGKGNAKKQAMVDSARRKFSVPIVDDNHADALWLLEIAISEFVDDV